MRRRAPTAVLAAACLVAAAAASARPSGGELIEHQVQTQADGMRIESWFDVSTGQHRSLTTLAGKPCTESVFSTADGKVQFDIVSYSSRTWTTFSSGFPGPRGETLAEYAQHYRDAVSRGFWTVVGNESLFGGTDVHLRRSSTMTVGNYSPTNTTDLWLDAFTYLPVRQQNKTTGVPGGPHTSEIAYDWLPRTPENLVNLVLVVPDGFKHTKGTVNSSSSSSSGAFTATQVLIGHS